MSQRYSDPSRKADPYALPDVEVFMANYCEDERHELPCIWDIGDDCNGCSEECGCAPKRGWFWQACFPGCMPDSDPIGPFATEAEAVRSVRGMERS